MRDILKPRFIVTLFLLTACIDYAECLRCYQCNNVSTVADCQHVITCASDESCYTDRSGAGSNTEYTLGCRSKQTCRLDTTSAPQTALIGRRDVVQSIVCSQCCGIDLCNQHVCASSVHGLHTNQCADDPNFNCAQVSELFNVCNDKGHAKLVCRKFCDLCDIIDGFWLDWSVWSTCSETCGDGVLTRTRSCNRTDGGLPCTGDNTEHQHCFSKACPVNGGWSDWSTWGGCSITCGVGFERRERHCSNPYPDPNGHFCDGDSWDNRLCSLQSCTDGTWSLWSSWGVCSATCDGGISRRSRTCDITVIGHSCIGQDEDYKVCNTLPCSGTHYNAIDGGWTIWSHWSTCSAYNCTSVRTRTCSNPTPSTQGKNCLGNSMENIYCNLEYCSHPVRLVNGSDMYEGRLEVHYNGRWGSVCDDMFTAKSAEVICRMLQYHGSATWYGEDRFGHGADSVLAHSRCNGDEDTLFDCQQLYWEYQDRFYTDCEHVGVSCHGDVAVRLHYGTSNNNGLVEVSRAFHTYVDSSWNGVCDEHFTSNVSGIVCSMLSLPTERPIIYSHGYYGGDRGSLFQLDRTCPASTTNIGHCGTFTQYNLNCGNMQGIGLACVDNIKVRLVNGSTPNEGRVEVSIDGNNWGPICSHFLYRPDAEVICRALGQPTDVPIPYHAWKFGPGASKHVLSDLGCSGSEASLMECDIRDVNDYCQPKDHVGVSCNTNIQVRLVNGSTPNEGRVEVSIDGNNWGPVCNSKHVTYTSLHNKDAQVICRMAGLPSNVALPYDSWRFGAATADHVLSLLNCNGTESSIRDCNLHEVEANCSHQFDLGVSCNTKMSIRLVNGSSPHNGRVEVSLDDNQWGPMVGYIRQNEAKVICKTLGFPSNVTITYGSGRFGVSTASPVLSHPTCTGSESSIVQCDTVSVNEHPSDNPTDVGVSCSSDLQVRLVNGTSPQNGRVEVSTDGKNWGPMCGSYSQKEARAVCNTLGLPSTVSIPYPASVYGAGTAPPMLHYIACPYSHNITLTDCALNTVPSTCDHNDDLGVSCNTNMDVRLVNGSSPNEGRVEVSLDGGRWGPICDFKTYYKVNGPKVICQMLGLSTHNTMLYPGGHFGQGTLPYLLPDVHCSRFNHNLADCTTRNDGWCGPNKAAAIRCGNN